MKFVAKIHEVDVAGRIEVILAISDREILGKKLGDYFFINPRFYGESIVGEEEIEKMLEKATIINAVGKNCVEKLVSMGIVAKEETKNIEGTPHAQVVLMLE